MPKSNELTETKPRVREVKREFKDPKQRPMKTTLKRLKDREEQ